MRQTKLTQAEKIKELERRIVEERALAIFTRLWICPPGDEEVLGEWKRERNKRFWRTEARKELAEESK